MKGLWMCAAMVVLTVATVAPAHASTISIRATNITSGDFLNYSGLGQWIIMGNPTGVGTGTYQLGSCSFNVGLNQTACTVTGSYVEVAGSEFNPGATGTFTFREVWSGNIANPIVARSVDVGSNTLQLHVTPAGSFFDLTLSNGFYGAFGPGSPAGPLVGALNWQSFLSNAVCSTTPAPSTCSVATVGLEPGTSISGNISPFDMQIAFTTNPPAVPEPATLVLCGLGLALAGRRRVARRRS